MDLRQKGVVLLFQSAVQLPVLLIDTFSSCRRSPAGNTDLFRALFSVCESEMDTERRIILVNHSKLLTLQRVCVAFCCPSISLSH